MKELFAVGLFGVLGPAVLMGVWCARRIGTRSIERRLDALHQQVIGWQAAHDHQVASIDRRMRDVEDSAARAENEARIVSLQMAEMSESLAVRLTQIERRDLGSSDGFEILAGVRS